MPSTIRLHRVFKTTPERLYKAFLDPQAMVKWLPPNGFACTVHHLEPDVSETPGGLGDLGLIGWLGQLNPELERRNEELDAAAWDLAAPLERRSELQGTREAVGHPGGRWVGLG